MRNGLISILKIKFSRFHNFTEHENKLNRFSDWTIFILLKISENESFLIVKIYLHCIIFLQFDSFFMDGKHRKENIDRKTKHTCWKY